MEDAEEQEDIETRRDIAFDVALGKLLETNGNLETLMQLSEAFGRGLFADYIKDNTGNWSIEEWIDETVEKILVPLGNTLEFSELTSSEVKTRLTKCLLSEKTNEPQVASLFTYGFMRGMLLSAFPKGELLMNNLQDGGHSIPHFTFKTKALYRDKGERERVKTSFKSTKKLGYND